MTDENKSKEDQGFEQKEADDQELLEEPIRIKDLILMTILSLESKAWAYLDLVAHPETQKHKKDINEARLAIDSIDVLYKMIEEQLAVEERKDIQLRLTNLRLNFVRKE